jgi:hypothetical protein
MKMSSRYQMEILHFQSHVLANTGCSLSKSKKTFLRTPFTLRRPLFFLSSFYAKPSLYDG